MISPSLSLQCNSTLLSLRLSGNKIGNRGAMHLASMLQVNNTLTELELADCDLVTTHTQRVLYVMLVDEIAETSYFYSL